MDDRYGEGRARYCDLCFRRCRGIYHVIEKGDTLYNLGQRFRVSVSDIMRANPYINVYNLKIGEEICLPVSGPQPREEITDFPQDNGIIPVRPLNSDQMQTDYVMPIEREPVMPETPAQVMPPQREMQNVLPENENVEETDQTEAGLRDMALQNNSIQNSFSEEDTLREVMDRLGITMEDLLQCVNNRE